MKFSPITKSEYKRAEENGVSTKLFHQRCRRMSPEEAAAMPYGGPKTKEG